MAKVDLNIPKAPFDVSTLLQGLPRPVAVGDELFQITEKELGHVREGQRLRVLSWNVQKFMNPESISDLHALQVKSDFLLLQETLTGFVYMPFYEQMSLIEWWAARNISFFDGIFAGITTGSKFSVGHVEALRSQSNEPILRTPKTALISSHPIEGSALQLMVVNVHGINFVPFRTYRRQFEQVYEAVKDHEGPLIIAGDFNTHMPNRRYLVSSFATSLGLDIVDFPADRRLLKLDQVLVRGFSIHEAQIMANIRSSDHAPVYVELEMK